VPPTESATAPSVLSCAHRHLNSSALSTKPLVAQANLKKGDPPMRDRNICKFSITALAVVLAVVVFYRLCLPTPKRRAFFTASVRLSYSRISPPLWAREAFIRIPDFRTGISTYAVNWEYLTEAIIGSHFLVPTLVHRWPSTPTEIVWNFEQRWRKRYSS